MSLKENREHGSAHGVIPLRYIETITPIISQEKYSMHNKKKSGGSSCQDLTKFIFSEFLITDFR